MKQLFKRLFPRSKAAVPVSILRRDIMRVSVMEWRSSPDLVAAARAVLANPVFRQMLDVAYASAPGRGVLPDNATPELRQHWQSKGEGYVIALATLESMQEPIETTEPLEATFEPEEAR